MQFNTRNLFYTVHTVWHFLLKTESESKLEKTSGILRKIPFSFLYFLSDRTEYLYFDIKSKLNWTRLHGKGNSE